MRTASVHRVASQLAAALLVASTAVVTLPTYSETIAIPLGHQGEHWNVRRPSHGLTMEQVEARYGKPIATSGPVGDPPIYTWEYPAYNVYFESNRVIHSVVKHDPKAQQETGAEGSGDDTAP